MRSFLSTILVTLMLFSFIGTEAQENKGGPKATSLSGQLLESQSKDPVEFAAVTILNSESDDIITGGMTDIDGIFSIDIPGSFERVKIQVTYLGFRSLENIIDLNRATNSELDLGKLLMEADDKMLDEVVVTAEQATMNLYVDRKVFNVDKDISTRGGTGEDVMRNIPGLDVDAEGNISMRNTTATIFIDGRPTTLELRSLPADMIEAVEVITNPSAKFDASSSGGIVNIKMKRNKKTGYNGTISAGVGTTDRYTAMATLNVRKNPFNLSLNYNLNQAGNIVNTYTDRTSFQNGQIDENFNQTNESYRGFQMNSFRAVLDYYMTPNDVLSFTGNASIGGWSSDEEQLFRSTGPAGMLNFSGRQDQLNQSNWRNYSAQLYYQKKFATKGRELTSDINYERSNRFGDTDIETINRDQNNEIIGNPRLQGINSDSKGDQITFQLDYVTPLANGGRFETGIRSFYSRSDYDNQISRFSYEENVFLPDSALSNRFDIIENINAAYVNYIGSWGSLDYQAGVRFEQSFYEGNIPGQESNFSYAYPSEEGDFFKALFPSLFLSRKIGDAHEVQFNVSRKIGRPRWWQLAPRVDINDPRNLRLGNPELKPEFINLSEINYSYQKGQWSWVSSVYGRLTEDPITWITYPFEDDEDILVTTSVNGTFDYNFGWENIVKFSPSKNLDLTLSVNTYYVRVNSSTPLGDFTNTGYTYDVKPMITYRMPWDFALQINGGYFAPRVMPQGQSIDNYYMDVSLSKKFGKKWVLNLILNDAFDSRIWGSTISTPTFTQESTRRRQARFLRFTATYNFGQEDPSWMKNRRRGGNREGGGDMDMDF